MKLHSAVIPQLQHVLTHGRWFTPSIIVLFLGLEMFGRQTTTDAHDTVGAVVLLLILAGIAVRHRVNPIGWVKSLGHIVWKTALLGDRFKVDIGPDLRGTPPIPQRLPFPIHAVGLLLLMWAVLAGVVWLYFPDGWRAPSIQITYLGYLAMMSVLWGLLFVSALGGVYFPTMLITRLTGIRSGDLRMSRGQLFFLGIYLAMTSFAAWLLPLWPVLAIAWLFWLGACVFCFIPGQPVTAQIIWRNPKNRKVRAVSIRRAILGIATFAVLLLSALIMSSAGGRVLLQPEETNTMRLTSMFGNWLGWLSPGLLFSAAGFVFLSWRNNPSRPARRTLHIAGAFGVSRKPVATLVRSRNWITNFDEAESTDVRIKLVSAERSQANEFDPNWPLAVSPDDLAGAPVYSRFARRAEIQSRRQLLRGLEKIFRKAKGRTNTGGCGYWLAPHLWFVAGLTRDEVTGGEEEPTFLTEIVGPPYAEVFDLDVRRYCYALLKSLNIDLVFVEDGVNYRKLARVIRRLYEIYDKGGGQKPAEDVQFQGLTKVRVLFHEFDINEPYRSGKYPEPKFAPLGRLRVMHVFRDRGADEERIEQPFEFDHTPAPQLLGI